MKTLQELQNFSYVLNLVEDFIASFHIKDEGNTKTKIIITEYFSLMETMM